MNLESIGAMIARAMGAILLLIGISGLLVLPPYFQSQNQDAPGWIGYAEITNATANIDPILHDSYYVTSASVTWHFPVFAQLLAGAALILFSKPAGRLLAKGLNTAPPKAN